MSENNGDWESLKELRVSAAELGVRVSGKNRYELHQAIMERQQRAKEEAVIVDLRKECARRGLSTGGSREDLELRLAANQDGAIRRNDRIAYVATAIFSIVLGIAALGISVPHVATELSELMNCNLYVGYLFAVVIDGGIIGLKIVDTLGQKFSLRRSVTISVWVLLIVCLSFSGLLNASQFLRHVGSNSLLQCMAVALAAFISGFVFLSFMIGVNMLVHCEGKTEKHTEQKTAAELFRAHAAMFDKLQFVADQLPKDKGDK